MPLSQQTRTTLKPEAHQALKVWAALEGKEPGELASDLILSHAPEKVISLISSKPISQKRPKAHKPDNHEVSKPQSQQAIKAELGDSDSSTTARTPLSKNPVAISRIKELWRSGVRNKEEISRKISYPPSTVRLWLTKHQAELEAQDQGDQATEKEEILKGS